MERIAFRPRDAVEMVLREQGRKLTWLAARVGTNRTTLHLMLIGERPLSDEMKAKIARELGVPLTMLFASVGVCSIERIAAARESSTEGPAA